MRSILRALLAIALLTSAAPGRADEPPPPNVEEAKRLFEQGESLRAAGQFQAALEAYLKSRALVPRATNTLNVAVCLHALKRFDEAYEYFEEALSKYPEAQLSKEARDSAKATLADIEGKVGRLDVSANVDATLVIDGRTRGKLPLLAPVRAMPGKHVVRLIRDGFITFEQTVEIVARDTAKIDAKLEALTTAGRLRVEGPPELDGANVTIDGAVVGTLPWEGTLQPGPHVYFASKGDLGSGPELGIVIVGQTVKVTIAARTLGPERRIVVEPATAALSIDGVAIGRGRFQGRLPVGAHVIEAREEGYVLARSPLEVTATDSSDVAVKLVVDPNHPRWGVSKGRLAIEVFGGFSYGPSFGNDKTAWCNEASPCSGSSVLGYRVGAGGLYELASGLSLSIRVGYASMSRSMTRRFARTSTVGAATVSGIYDLEDEIKLTQFFAGLGIGYRISLGERFDLGGRVELMISRARATDRISGTASGGGRTAKITSTGSGAAFDAVMFEAAPELSLGAWLGKHVRASFALAAPIAVLRGPRLQLGDTYVIKDNTGACTTPTIDCTSTKTLDPNDMPVSNVFVRVETRIGVGYWF